MFVEADLGVKVVKSINFDFVTRFSSWRAQGASCKNGSMSTATVQTFCSTPYRLLVSPPMIWRKTPDNLDNTVLISLIHGVFLPRESFVPEIVASL
jgi:hypothetical protein